MTLDPAAFLRLVWQTVTDPAGTARMILSLDLSRGVLWQGLVLVTTLSVLLGALVQGGRPALPGADGVEVGPLAYAMILGASLVLMVFAIHFTGRSMGGTGDFGGAIALVVWLEAVAMVVRFVQGLLLLLAPPLAGLFSIAALAVLLWCLVTFVDVLHGFRSRGKAALVLILAVFGLGVGLMLILSLIGVGAATGGLNDV